MKLSLFAVALGLSLAMTPFAEAAAPSATHPPLDLSKVRGFNYTTSLDKSVDPRDHAGLWLLYDQAQVDRDLDRARILNLNQVRVFVSYTAWRADKSTFNRNLLNFLRSCHQRGIGVMLGLIDQPYPPADPHGSATQVPPETRQWLTEMVHLLGGNPGLAFWDAGNEPDNPGIKDPALRRRRIDLARAIAVLLRQLDKRTPVTIGCTLIPCMIETAPSVDVLSFHDYSPTRAQIHGRITEAQAFASTVHKQVFNSEIGCIGRANPYDIALEEFQHAGMGWYLWELTITPEWGNVHGVFYPDGTVRDPSIAAAILGFFRNRGPSVVLENPDRERWVTRAVTDGRKWLNQPTPDWQEGLKQAEIEANILETAQLVPMRDPPTRMVEQFRRGAPNLPALQELVRHFISTLEPYQTPHPPSAP